MSPIVDNWVFGFTLALYLAASGAFHVYLFGGSDRARKVALVATGLGALAHLGAIIAQAAIHRACPFVTAGPTISFIAWLLVLVQLLMAWRQRWLAIGAVTLPVAFAAVSYAAALPVGRLREPGLIHHPLWSPHVIATVLGFVAFAVAFGIAVIYLVEQSLLKRKKILGLFSRMPPLASLNTVAHRFAVAGFSLLTLGLATGTIWAMQHFTPGWYLEAKIVTSFLAWFVYAIYLLLCGFGGWQGRRNTYFLIAGFVVVLVAYFGVSLVAPGQHPSSLR